MTNELQQLLDTYEKETGYTRYDAEQIALRYAELAAKEERERIVGILEEEKRFCKNIYCRFDALETVINQITKVEE